MSTLLNAKMEQQKDNAITAFKNQIAQLQEQCARYKAILTSRDKEIEELDADINKLEDKLEEFGLLDSIDTIEPAKSLPDAVHLANEVQHDDANQKKKKLANKAKVLVEQSMMIADWRKELKTLLKTQASQSDKIMKVFCNHIENPTSKVTANEVTAIVKLTKSQVNIKLKLLSIYNAGSMIAKYSKNNGVSKKEAFAQLKITNVNYKTATRYVVFAEAISNHNAYGFIFGCKSAWTNVKIYLKRTDGRGSASYLDVALKKYKESRKGEREE